MLRPSFCACSYCVSTTRNIAQRRAANRGLWGLSPGELCQQTDRGNGKGGGCSGSEAESQPVYQSPSAGNGGEAVRRSCPANGTACKYVPSSTLRE
jgi:hypothetical protein